MLPWVQLCLMVSGAGASQAKNPTVCYLGFFFFGRIKLAFRWRDLPLRSLVLGNGEKGQRRCHRKVGCLLYTEEVVGSPDQRDMVALLSECIPAWKE